MPPIVLGLTAPIIQKARVVDVDTRNYVCTVVTEMVQKPLTWVSFMTPYQHFDNGEGIYFMPEVGSVCWVCFPSDQGMAFILGWCSIEDAGASHRNRKMDLNPGDIYLGTRDENRIILRRGGVIQIGATPLSQRFYLPIDNIIKDLCENYYMETLAGELSWSLDLKESTSEGTDGHRPGSFKLSAREFSDDPKPVANLQIGSHKSNNDTILSLGVFNSGATGQQPRVNLTISKTGTVEWALRNGSNTAKAQWDVAGDVSVAATKAVTIDGAVSTTLSGGTVTVRAKSGSVSVVSGNGATALKVGKATAPVLLATPALLTWLKTHTHSSSGAGPPVTSPPEATIKSKDILSS